MSISRYRVDESMATHSDSLCGEMPSRSHKNAMFSAVKFGLAIVETLVAAGGVCLFAFLCILAHAHCTRNVGCVYYCA